MKASHLVLVLPAALTCLLVASQARAGGLIIKSPNDHPPSRWELEPHVDFGLWRYGGAEWKGHPGFGEPEFGVGFRATVKIVDPGFVPKINDTVGITFGIDLTGCGSYCGGYVHTWLPVGLQWNFFLTREWSVFGDFGFMPRITTGAGNYNGFHPDFFFMAGGRYHFNDKVSLTMRVGYPFVSVGVSFFAG